MNHLYGAVATAFLLVAGCGAAVGPAETREDPVALEQLPRQFADELCEAIAPCCAAAQIAYDATTCKNAASEVYQLILTMRGGADANYDPAGARACLSSLKSVIASCGAPVPAAGDVACNDILGAWKLRSECAGPKTCAGDFYSAAGSL